MEQGRGINHRGALLVLLLLFVPALVTVVSRTAGLISSACAVAALVYLVLRNERRTPPGA